MINEAVRERLGRWRSADILMRSVDFQAVVDMQRAVLWDEIGHHLGTAARPLKAAGAVCIVECFGRRRHVAETRRSVRTPAYCKNRRKAPASANPSSCGLASQGEQNWS
ncbi:hypothetical protein [Methylobacterium sp. 190mf]|uniref:hypothetical protein n=1 Tax=Methylobacterium sp. 190mf TaxID=1761798 RepID=UPI0011B05C1F|nr:hypothetical protein [Methylobacterium sp. 190mf]